MHLKSRLGNDEYRNWVEVGQFLLFLSEVIHSYLVTEFDAFFNTLTVMVGSGTKCHCTHAPRKHDTHSCKWAQAIASYHRCPSKIAWRVSDNSKWDDPVTGPMEIARLYSAEKSVGGLRYLQLLRRCSYFKVSERALGDVIDVWKSVWENASNQSLGHEEKLRAVDAITKVLHESSFRGNPNTKKASKEIQSVGFWDYPKLQAAEVNVMRNYRELLENKRQKMAEDIIDVNTKLENTKSQLKTALEPDQRTTASLRESFLFLSNFVAANFKLFTKSRKHVRHYLTEAICGFLSLCTFYVSVLLILGAICILAGIIAAVFAAVSCSLYVKAFKQI